MTRRYGMPSERTPWVRVVAAILAAALVVSLGYSALTILAAPGWTILLLLVGAVALVVGLLTGGSGRAGR